MIAETNLNKTPMKKTHYSLLMLTLILTACSVGANKDFNTGLSFSYNGFTVERVVLVGADNIIKSDNVVPINSAVAIAVEGLSGYTLKDEKAYPGLMLRVTDQSGVAVLDQADLFAKGDGYAPADAAIIRGTIQVGNPMKAGETYHVLVRVWDKNNIDNELTAEVDIEVK